MAPAPPAAPGGAPAAIVPLARDFTRQALYDWGWLPAATADRRAAAEDVLLVVSELVTNACLHAEGPEELRVAATPRCCAWRSLTSARASRRRAPRTAPGRPGGHGMFIVQRLCLDWGVVRITRTAGQDRLGGARAPPGLRAARPGPRLVSGVRILNAACGARPIRRALCLPSPRSPAYLERPI